MNSAAGGARWALPLALAILVLGLGLVLGRSLPLLDPDEGRNAEIAREMATGGDLLVPHLAGMPYLDKPPGLFWATAAAIGLAGRSPWAARLPAAVAAALTVWLVCRSAARSSGPALAVRAGLLLAAAPLFAFLSAYVIFDMLLALCVTVLWTGLVAEVERGPSRGRRLVMFAAVGAGLLVKGPVMLAWAVGGSAGAALLIRSRAPLRWLAWVPGWALALGVAGGWFALASARHPEYPRYALLEESLERLTTGSFHRDQPWWTVPLALAAGALPWSLATPWRRSLSRGARVALGFALFAVVFFMLSRSKLVTYLLPALPPLAWVAAEAWAGSRPSARAGWSAAGAYAALALALTAAVGWLPGLGPAAGAVARPAVPWALPAALAGLAAVAVAAALARRPGVAFAACLAFTPLVLWLARPALVAYAASQSGAPLARAIAAASPAGKVCYEFCYSPGTDFLLGRTSELVAPLGRETTSNYQVRYRELLVERGQWTALGDPGDCAAAVVVRPAGDDRPAPGGGIEFFRDGRFRAYRMPRAGRDGRGGVGPVSAPGGR